MRCSANHLVVAAEVAKGWTSAKKWRAIKEANLKGIWNTVTGGGGEDSRVTRKVLLVLWMDGNCVCWDRAQSRPKSRPGARAHSG